MNVRGPLCLLATLATLGASPQARAWDPVETHPALIHEAALASSVHARWMTASGGALGWFSPLRLDPGTLSARERSDLLPAMADAPVATGIGVRGGPATCPGPDAPPSTRTACVEGDTWEASALAWLKLGAVVETTPRARLLHHFVDRRDPRGDTWSDAEVPPAVLRQLARSAGMPLAQGLNRTGFDGRAVSAVAWLRDPNDPWSLPAVREHLRRATLDPDPAVRERELVLALLGLGAVLHVLQDLSVPAHARGDIAAFLQPLSTTPGDLGLPLQEFARLHYGQFRLPTPLDLRPRDATEADPESVDSTNVPRSVEQILWGTPGRDGLIDATARRFFSESSLPPPQSIDPTASPIDAAAQLLGEEAHLAETTRAGAVLAPWPAPSGYLRTGTGRPLAAFSTLGDGRIQLYLDRVVYRDQTQHLLPLARNASIALLDLMISPVPAIRVDAQGGTLELELDSWSGPTTVSVWRRGPQGSRAAAQRFRIPGGKTVRLNGIRWSERDAYDITVEGRDAAGRPMTAMTHAPAAPAAAPKAASTPQPSGTPQPGDSRQPTGTAPPAGAPQPEGAPQPAGNSPPAGAPQPTGTPQSRPDRPRSPAAGKTSPPVDATQSETEAETAPSDSTTSDAPAVRFPRVDAKAPKTKTSPSDPTSPDVDPEDETTSE